MNSVADLNSPTDLDDELSLAVEECCVMIWEDPEKLVQALEGLELTEQHVRLIHAAVDHARGQDADLFRPCELAVIQLFDVLSENVENYARGDL